MELRLVLAGFVLLAACGDDADGPRDAATSDVIDFDPDATTDVCTSDPDCENGSFCDGEARCEPESPDADVRGCVIPTEGPCLPGQSCDDAERRCLTDCDLDDDADDDGAPSIDCGGNDCDDSDGLRRPGAAEICDAEDRDEDCDPTTFGVRDGDSDGEPDAQCCNTDSAGAMVCGTDCDDSRAGISPRVPEVCNGLDDDCDTSTDEGVVVDLYRDSDGDMFGSADMTMEGCPESMVGWVPDMTDCDDARGDIHPGAVDRCDPDLTDDDCNGTPNDPPGGCECITGASRPCTSSGICASGVEMCIDGSYGACSISPEPFETCDGEDDDCNGTVDDGLRRPCWPDGDLDGYAALGAMSSSECATPGGRCPAGFTDRSPMGADVDCNDASASRSPAVTELCNGIDDNCSGTVDELLTVTCYSDRDNDTYAPMTASATERCPDPSRDDVGRCPAGFTNRPPTSALTRDCNDDPAMGGSGFYPGAVESCDGADNDCDGTVDDGARQTCFTDGDDDTYAASGASSMMLCRVLGRDPWGGCPSNFTFRSPAGASTTDCNDGNLTIFPGAIELCGGGDHDCDGDETDEVTISCFTDGDDDTYAPAGAVAAPVCPVAGREIVGGCPSGRTNRAPTAGNVDCADADGTRKPGIAEMCDEPTFVDANCNGDADEGAVLCYRDADDDGYSFTGAATARSCLETTRAGSPHFGCDVGFTGRAPTALVDRDCSDTNPALHTIVQCYNDGDADGYPPSTATSTNVCYSASNPGYGGCTAGRNARAPIGADIDCCDATANAKPGQLSYFSVPRPASCGAPAYDYNCSGTESRQYTTISSDTECAGTAATCGGSADDGWFSSPAPACGDSDFWISGCDYYLEDPGPPRIFTCELAGSDRAQPCR
jgi:hypothetical protein